jgi:hypothetical protein
LAGRPFTKTESVFGLPVPSRFRPLTGSGPPQRVWGLATPRRAASKRLHWINSFHGGRPTRNPSANPQPSRLLCRDGRQVLRAPACSAAWRTASITRPCLAELQASIADPLVSGVKQSGADKWRAGAQVLAEADRNPRIDLPKPRQALQDSSTLVAQSHSQLGLALEASLRRRGRSWRLCDLAGNDRYEAGEYG